VILIGEKIHTMYGEINEAVKNRDPGPVLELARAQADAGADYLDVNLCTIMNGAEEAMAWAVGTIQDAMDIPIVLDIPSAGAMKAGLKVRQGETVINGIAGTEESKANMYPLAAQYQTDVIMGLYTDQGAPTDADERSLLAVDLVAYANEVGIPTERIWIDPGVYPLANNQQQVVAGLEFMRTVQDVVPGVKTVTGISNVSALGPPPKLRRVLNHTYFVIARRYYQHAAIVNVLDEKMVRLNRGELPELMELIHRVMDGEEIRLSSLSSAEVAYVTAARMILGKEPYSLSAFRL